MAVSLSHAGAVTSGTGTSAILSVTCAGTNRAILVLAQFKGPTPTGVTAIWDAGGANQSMTLIRSWDNGVTPNNTYFYMFGLVGPAVVSGSAVSLSWTGFDNYVGQASCWNGVNQTSVAAAFTNGVDANGNSTTPQVNVTSATGDIAVAHVMTTDTLNFDTLNDTTLYAFTTNWGNVRSGANYASGAATVTLDGTIGGGVGALWYYQGINIVQVAVPQGSAILAAAGGLTAGLAPATTSALQAGAGKLAANAVVLPAGSDSDVVAWKTAVIDAGGTVSTPRETLVTNFVAGLKADGLWTKIDRVWLLAAENNQSARVDLKARILATAVNNPTFTTDFGYACNGSSYLDLIYNFSTDGVSLNDNSAHIAFWNTLNSNSTLVGLTDFPGAASCHIYPKYTDGNIYGRVFEGFSGGFAIADPTGFLLANRDTGSSEQLYHNGVVVGDSAAYGTQVTTGAPNRTLALYGWPGAVASVGGSLSSAEQLAYYNRVNTYMVGLVVGNLINASALLAATATLTASSSLRLRGSALLSSAGQLAANATVSAAGTVSASAALAAAASLTASARLRLRGSAIFSGAGQVAANATIPVISDTDTAAWKAAVVGIGGTVGPDRETLVNAFILALKAAGLWTKLDRVWLLAAENNQSARVDLKARIAATAINAPVFTTDVGYACNGSSYLDLNYNFATDAVSLNDNSGHLAVWNTLNSTSTAPALSDNGAISCHIYPKYTDNNIYGRIFESFSGGFAIGDPTGFLVANRSSATAEQLYHNGATVADSSAYGTQATTGAPNRTLLLYGWPGAAASVGSSLSQADQLAYYDILSDYMVGVHLIAGDTFINASALFAAAGSIAVVISGTTTWPASALLAAAGRLDASSSVRSTLQFLTASLAGSAGFTSSALKRSVIQAGASLRAAAGVTTPGTLSIEADPQPRVRHSDPTYEGVNGDVKIMITSHLNDAHVLEIGGGGMIPVRGAFGHGPMQAGTLQPPLVMDVNGRISIDINALKALLGI